MGASSRITSIGSFLPEKSLSNDDIAKLVDTNNEWILSRTGIKSRHISDLPTSAMAVMSANDALANSKVPASSIDAIIVATTTGDLSFPSVACMVQSSIGAKNAFCFDLSAACSGFVYALSVADKLIKCGDAKKVMVIGADKMSSLVDWKDRSTCILFGDGAGAVLLDAVEDDAECQSRIIASKLCSDGSEINLLKTSGGISTTQNSGCVLMNGSEVFKNAVTKLTNVTLEILESNGMSITDVDLIVPHQANKRIIELVAKHLKINMDKICISIENHGNTSAASIPLAMSMALKNGRLKRGDTVLLHCIGAGLTWGACLLKF